MKLTVAVICMASSTLAIFEPDKNEFLSLLVRLALSESSPSSTAVLQSALALSSFHRHGLQADVFRFKARALHALIISSNHCIERPAVVQHIAASMILCHLEVCSNTCPYLGLINTHQLSRCSECPMQYPYGSVSDVCSIYSICLASNDRSDLPHWFFCCFFIKQMTSFSKDTANLNLGF
jgi:hypothetical protein